MRCTDERPAMDGRAGVEPRQRSTDRDVHSGLHLHTDTHALRLNAYFLG